MDLLRRLVSSSTTLTQSIASMDRVFHLFDEKYDVKMKMTHKTLSLKKHITFDDVSFKYNDYEDEVLKHINLDINKGETVAFVGMSGGGKSTLISLLPDSMMLRKVALVLIIITLKISQLKVLEIK